MKLLADWFGAFMFAFHTTAFAAASPFVDVPANHWAYDAVVMLASEGINQGYGDGSFRGDKNITRYEAATMLAKFIASTSRSFGDGVASFRDVSSKHWAHDSVALLAGAGVIQGYSDGTFRGDQNITRYEMAAMVSKLVSGGSAATSGANPFIDMPNGHWAADAVKMLATKGINEGYADGTFRGEKNITRYEAATILARAMVSS